MAKNKSNAANAGNPSWGGKGNGFAQSGGKATKFAGGSGGSAYGAKSTARKVVGKGVNNTGNAYTVVANSGDTTPTRQTGHSGRISGTRNDQGYNASIKRNYNKPANG